MLRYLGALVVAAAAITGGCSSTEPMAVEFSHAQQHGTVAFTVTGEAVDGDMVCPDGTQTLLRLENVDGEEIVDADWAEMFDTALEAGTVAEMMVYYEWTCADGSGSFTMEHHNVFDFSTFEFEGRQDVGTWEINEGAGSLAGLAGAGTVVLDWDAEQVTYSGEVEEA